MKVRMKKKMSKLMKIDYSKERPTVSARELHEFLETKTKFRHWFPRMCEYGFKEGMDYTPVIFDHPQNKQQIKDYQITIPMGKELCMLQRTEKGKQARLYFITVEEAWNTPEMVMSRALKMAEGNISSLHILNSRLSVENAIMQPKAEYFDELVDRNLLTNFRDTAKALKVGERKFIKFLLDSKYIYRDKKSKLKPYADKNNGLFEIKEVMNDKTGWVGTQTLISPKGRETFRLLIPAIKEDIA